MTVKPNQTSAYWKDRLDSLSEKLKVVQQEYEAIIPKYYSLIKTTETARINYYKFYYKELNEYNKKPI